jgi:hypothetical protein
MMFDQNELTADIHPLDGYPARSGTLRGVPGDFSGDFA